MKDDRYISLAHGNGGRRMRYLIEQLLAPILGDLLIDIQSDATPIQPQLLRQAADHDAMPGELMVTTDGFSVQPLEFPGGNIGSLAVHGTVNDLAVSGACAQYLCLNMFLEEGIEIALLQRIIEGLACAAREAGVRIAAGDTKVVQRGEGGGIYLATTGIGMRTSPRRLAMSSIRPGDAIVVSGPIGDHGIAVMLAREQFGMRGGLRSDSANVYPLTSAVDNLEGLRFMRDPTRGGLATVLHEIGHATGLGATIYAGALPIRDEVKSVCAMLGYDPLYMACEGRVVAIVAPEQAGELVRRWQLHMHASNAAVIGTVSAHGAPLILETALGGQRVLQELDDEPLPRIC